MKGSFSISVQNNTVKYAFSLKRNITIIQGDSATGKTTLVDLIREYEQNGTDSGISLSCEKKCRVLEGNDWNSHLSLLKNCIIFIDEGNRFVEGTVLEVIQHFIRTAFFFISKSFFPEIDFSLFVGFLTQSCNLLKIITKHQ
ncbi:hypothetical protein [uncultured Treponema sp.]|uniref:hypothetical protein n=1 Tax=uncultured Treponema sp. TaxID=162155 RepID=UPI002589F5C4|nr:hypothetical protein [uncultured Treponema sp.]